MKFTIKNGSESTITTTQIKKLTSRLYNVLLEAGLSEDVAVALTAKLIGEIIKAGGSKQKENEQ